MPPDLLEQGLFDPGGQLGRDRRRVPLGQVDQPGDEPFGSAEDLLEIPSKKSRVIRLLLGEQVTDLGQDDRQPVDDRGISSCVWLWLSAVGMTGFPSS
jgi:hypothetical protein